MVHGFGNMTGGGEFRERKINPMADQKRMSGHRIRVQHGFQNRKYSYFEIFTEVPMPVVGNHFPDFRSHRKFARAHVVHRKRMSILLQNKNGRGCQIWSPRCPEMVPRGSPRMERRRARVLSCSEARASRNFRILFNPRTGISSPQNFHERCQKQQLGGCSLVGG